MKKLILTLMCAVFVSAQADIVNAGLNNGTISSYTFAPGDSVYVEIDWQNTPTFFIATGVTIRYYTSSDGTGAAAATEVLSVPDSIYRSANASDPYLVTFRLPTSINSSYQTFDVRINYLDGAFASHSFNLRDETAQAGFQNYGTIIPAFSFSTISLREGASAGDTEFVADGSSDEPVSVHIAYTGTDDPGATESAISSLRVLWYDNADPSAGTKLATNTILLSDVDNYSRNATDDSLSFTFNLPAKPTGAVSFQLYIDLDVSDEALSYTADSDFPSAIVVNSSIAGFGTFATITQPVVISALGFRDGDDDNQYITTSTADFEIWFTVSSGTVPSTASSVSIYQLDSDSNTLQILPTETNVTITNEGGSNYSMSIPNSASSFNASLNRFVVYVKIESFGNDYVSSTVSDQPTFTAVNNAPASYFNRMFDGTPVISKLAIQAATSTDSLLNVSEQIRVRFEIGANQEPLLSSNTMTIYEFNSSDSELSQLSRISVSLTSEGANEYSAVINGLSSFNAATASIAVDVDLANTSVTYKTKAEISGGTLISDVSVGGAGSWFSEIRPELIGPTAPSNLSLRYGAPSDNILFLSFDAGSGNDGTLTGHRIVWSTSALAADDTTRTGGGSILLSTSAQSEYRVNLGAATAFYLSVYSVDDNGEVTEAEFNSGNTLTGADGMTYTLSGNAYVVPPPPTGNVSDFTMLSFQALSGGLSDYSNENMNLSSITFTTIDRNANVSSDIIGNLRVYQDANSNNTLDGGDLLMNTVSQSWADGSFTVSFTQNNSLSNGSSYDFILVGDLTDADNTMTINVSIGSSNYALADDGSITAAETATLNGTVSAQGSEALQDITLPVALVNNSFKGVKVRNGIALTAQTASESNVRFIRYQRSTSVKSVDALTDEDWIDTGLKIESSEKYSTSGRQLPRLIDEIDTKSVLVLRYRLVTEEIDGTIKTYDADGANILTIDPNILHANEYSLSQNYPNPFNPSTTISFDLPYETAVSLEIFNVLGQKVRTLLNNRTLEGRVNHSVQWNGLNDRGQRVPSGMYFYRISSAGQEFVQTKKMILLK